MNYLWKYKTTQNFLIAARDYCATQDGMAFCHTLNVCKIISSIYAVRYTNVYYYLRLLVISIIIIILIIIIIIINIIIIIVIILIVIIIIIITIIILIVIM